MIQTEAFNRAARIVLEQINQRLSLAVNAASTGFEPHPTPRIRQAEACCADDPAVVICAVIGI